MKKKLIIAITTIVILAGVGVGSYFLKTNMNKSTKTTMEFYTVPSTDKVFINGEIKPENTDTIYLEPTRGEVNEVNVKNGDTVEKGAPLFTYKNSMVESQLEQLQLQLTTAKKQRDALLKQKAEMEKQAVDSKKQMEEAQKKIEDIQKNNGGVALNEEQLAELANMAKKQQMPANIGASQVSTETVDEQIKLLEKQVKSLEDKEYYTVKAPISGKIIMSDNKSNPTKPYITIESNDYYVSGSVNEKDKPKIKDGQVVEINVLSTNQNIKGKISNISNNPENGGGASAALMAAQSGAQSGGGSSMSYYSVSIIPDDQKGLTNGFHVQVSVSLEQKPIEIPKSAILKDDAGKDFVFLNVDGKLKKQEVTYSTKDGDKENVIVHGLKENEEVVTNPTASMKEGMAVE